MLLDQLAQLGDVLVGLDLFQLDHAQVAVAEERVVRVPDVGDAAATCRPRSCGRSGRGSRRGRRSCTRSRGRRRLRSRRAAPLLRTQNRSAARPRKNASPLVAPYSATLPMMMLSSGTKLDFGGRIDDEPAAGEALADVVVRVAFQFQRDAAGQERAEALPGRAGELEVDRAVRQTLLAPPLGDLVAEDRADRAVRVDDRQARRAPASPCSSAGLASVEQLRAVERQLEAVVLRRACSTCRRPACGFLIGVSSSVRSRPSAFQCWIASFGFQAIDAADHLVDRAEAELGHDLRGRPRRP